jgi:hydrogenase expression/formation protein HypE
VAARLCDVQIVTGDTKVVPRGAVDGLFINTAGIGESLLPMPGPAALQPGDQLIVSGPIGCHGLAVLSARERLEFDPPPQSDSAPLFPAVERLHMAGVAVRALRDATRGGVTAVLHEWAAASQATLVVDADRLPVDPVVRGVSELLGLDPLRVACEGTMVVAVASDQVDAALAALRQVPVGHQACRIGEVSARRASPVALRRLWGQLVALDEPAGAPLPRIC